MPCMRTLVIVASTLSVCIVGAHARKVTAQSPASFEVATVKRNVSGDTQGSLRRAPGGRLNAVNQPLRRLIAFANQLQPYQLVNVPAWAETERFDVLATMTADPPRSPFGDPNDPLLMAMRLLLAERFKLVTHRDMREMDVYALVMARRDGKPGPALRRTTQDCPRALDAVRRGDGPPAGPAPSVICGIRTPAPGRLVAGGAPLSMFISVLIGPVGVGRYVDDRTGLTGDWDFELTFAPNSARGAPPIGAEPPAADPDAPSLFTALQEQLGLKLEATRGPVPIVVIDRLERPVTD